MIDHDGTHLDATALRPGDVISNPDRTGLDVILRRKTEDEDIRHPGWWLLGGGGYGDFVLDGGAYQRVGRLHPHARYAAGIEATR